VSSCVTLSLLGRCGNQPRQLRRPPAGQHRQAHRHEHSTYNPPRCSWSDLPYNI
jgi:hypothetical protein